MCENAWAYDRPNAKRNFKMYKTVMNKSKIIYDRIHRLRALGSISPIATQYNVVRSEVAMILHGY